MIEKFSNWIRMQCSQIVSGQANVVVGQIISYDPQSFYAQVELYAADPTLSDSAPLQSGWLPITVPAIGWYTAPNIGDLVLVHFQEGSLQNGFISLVAYTGQVAFSVPSGEWWFMHPSGSFLKFTNDGKIIINGNLEIDLNAPTINITANVMVNVNAPTVNLGNLTSGTLKPLLAGAAKDIFNSHVHTVTGGSTSAPTTTIPPTDVTTNVQAT